MIKLQKQYTKLGDSDKFLVFYNKAYTMNNFKYITLLLLCAFFISCKREKPTEDIKAIVSEWIGKEVKFPDHIRCQSFDKDTGCISFTNPSYKIVLYTDSIGCTGCKLKLPDWKKLLTEADSLFPGEVDFLLFFQPKERDVKELSFLFKRDKFDHPVFIDMGNQINKLNHFPSRIEFQCFLLDQNNKVVLLGNPALNPQIWELYKEQITGKSELKTEILTTVHPVNNRVEIQEMAVGESYQAVFKIENTGNYPLIITDIKSSCGCTVPSWDKQPILPGGKTEVIVEVKPDTEGFFNKTISVYGNITNPPLRLSIIGMVK